MNEDTQPQTEQNLEASFDETLHERPSFTPQDLPMEWEVGQHRYIRVLETEGSLNAKLVEFRELGVKVLDYDRRWGFWVFIIVVCVTSPLVCACVHAQDIPVKVGITPYLHYRTKVFFHRGEGVCNHSAHCVH